MGKGGNASKAIASPPTDFTWDTHDEPHATRRKLITAKYPQIKKLFGPCPKLKYQILGAVTAQVVMAWYIHDKSWTAYFVAAYVFGGTLNHMLMMGMHELSHNLAFKTMFYNRVLSLVANFPLGVPAAISFKRYHSEHHRYQGEDGVDVDIPTQAEGRFFNTRFRKLFFICFQGLFYSFRPFFVNPKAPCLWEFINYGTCIGFNSTMVYLFGWSGMNYFLLSTLLGMGPHPCAGHFISEHYVFVKGSETYSYYGPLNIFTFNVGYHNEHHDFPFVAGSRLPEVRAMAPEFYENLPQTSSWIGTLYDYIMDENINAYSRVKRKTLSAADRNAGKAAAFAAPTDFMWDTNDEPHATRRKLITAKYPQIKNLFGPCPRTKFQVAIAVSLQTAMTLYISDKSWTAYFVVAYVFGGTINHMMMLAMHELAHNLGFKKMIYNRFLSLVANFPLGVPAAISFKRYHMEHHRYQGEDGVDVDIPTIAEGKFFTTRFRKFLFVCTQSLFYSFRPLIVNPKAPGIWEFINYVTCISYNSFIYYFCGWSGVFYLLLSTMLGAGPHPCAGHFISEHYVFVKGTETYSYYGILNLLTFNVGYHNEHHDFPFVAGSRLPEVRAMAPEFYDTLPQTSSWVGVLYDYIMDDSINAYSRVKRKTLSESDRLKLKSE
ncbi:sphingolipid delta(4)-desaturase DES1 [Thraustotheca clavata]|uniref:sphingolipid 4-desaturase n=1 Tax=Thraustotheca clavata TaxID=74557 RepID=A0A1W0A500_9STRA|nr:sphingolipid delta(4)-desaturase DES1 [Thraustotheca clavata]